MSLVLNGGIGGSGTTQAAYLDARIVSALPIIASVWYRNGTDSNSGGRSINWAQSDAAAGTYYMGVGHSRSVGPSIADSIQVRDTSATVQSVGTRTDLSEGRYGYPISGITTGATTVVSFDALGDSAPYAVGMYVRATGTLTGVSGFVVSRDYRVSAVGSGTVTLEVASTGELTEGWTGYLRWSAWQPERWNLSVIRFSTGGDPARVTYWSGFFDGPGMTMYSEFLGDPAPATIFDLLDRICVGGLYQSSTIVNHYRGELAHVGVWQGVELDDSKAGELLTLAPNLVSWGTPLAYIPCIDDGVATVGATNLTTVGSPSYTSDGPAITTSGGGGGGSYLPLMRARNTHIFGVR